MRQRLRLTTLRPGFRFGSIVFGLGALLLSFRVKGLKWLGFAGGKS